MPFGWAGTVLRIDLTKGKVVKVPLSSYFMKYFIGGRGVNSRVLYAEVGPEVDPLSPENRLIFGVGPLDGALVPGGGRWTVTAKSPLTGIHGDANAGGHWGAELKYAGYDHIIIEGKAKEPSYLWIDDDNVEIRNARHIWGKDIWETDKIIKEELGDPNVKVSAIGPAGENLVRFANIVCDLFRAAGRTGMGAVQGSKNLKAIAIRGTKGVKIANPKSYEKAINDFLEKEHNDPSYKVWSTLGTPALVRMLSEGGTLSVMNNQYTSWDKAIDISGETFLEQYVVKSQGCFSCPLHCSHYYIVNKGKYIHSAEGVEFETLGNLGSRLGDNNLAGVLMAGQWCNRLGMDQISISHGIALLMECFQKGLIDESFTDGVRFDWGDTDLVIDTIQKIAYRKGIGDLLAEGAVRVARKVGKEAENLVVQTKGMGYTASDQRARKGGVLAYATATRGGDHLRGLPTLEVYHLLPDIGVKLFGSSKAVDGTAYETKGRMVTWCENLCAIADSLEVCKFQTAWLRPFSLYPQDLLQIFNAITGAGMTLDEFFKVGERVYNVEKAFNTRLGLSRADDKPPYKYLNVPVPAGPAKGEIVSIKDFNKMLDEYYEAREWDKKTSYPTEEKLRKLGLDDVADDLIKRNIIKPRKLDGKVTSA